MPLVPLLVGAAATAALLASLRGRSRSKAGAQKPNTPPAPQPPPNDPESPPTDSAPQNPYGVFDEAGTPIDTAPSEEEAEKIWQEKTGKRGSFYRLADKQDLTPQESESTLKKLLDFIRQLFGKKQRKAPPKPPRPPLMQKFVHEMTPQELQEVAQEVAEGVSHNVPRTVLEQINLRLLAIFIEKMLGMDLPCFRVARKVMDEDFDLVPIKKREQRTRRRETTRVEFEDRVVEFTEEVESPFPADEMSVRRLRVLSELRRLRPRAHIALPQALLAKRLVQRELVVTQFLALEPQEQHERKAVRIPQTVDEPYVHEWVEQMKVPKAPSGQLMVMLIDISGSMNWLRLTMAMALSMAVVRRGRDNSSRYFLRFFADGIGDAHCGLDKAAKEKLLHSIPQLCAETSLGTGTQILRALAHAAQDIRTERQAEDQPEVLLITDGDYGLDPAEILEVLGTDITLHTVNVGIPNAALKKHSSTYAHLNGWDNGELYIV